jgi:cell wall assembly regulator SMI1
LSGKKVFEEIIKEQKLELSRTLNCMNNSLEEDIKVIEHMIQDKLPESFIELYEVYNGEKDNNTTEYSVFLGKKFLSTREIIDDLKFSLSLVKPKDRIIDNPQDSIRLTDEIVHLVKDAVVSEIKTHGFNTLRNKWHKIEFKCSTNSFSGVYFYNENDEDYEIVDLDCLDNVFKLVEKLHDIEREGYNWDEIEFIAYGDGNYQVNRKDYNFSEEINFISIPEGKIKKMYFNHKWIPMFSDHSGNFIGIDLEPDYDGIKGQVINFGRDEEKMFVYANDLEQFFETVLKLIKTKDFKKIIKKVHLHD